MSEPLKVLVAAGGTTLVTMPFTIIAWKRADRDATKLINQLTPPADLELTDCGREWLHAQFMRRLQWTALATQLSIVATAALAFGFRAIPIIGETLGPLHAIVAMFIGITLGGTLALVRSARATAISRRTAILTPRTLGTYVRRWERWLYAAHLATAVAAFFGASAWRLKAASDSEHPTVVVILALAWVLGLGTIGTLQGWIMRAPPVVDEETHTARELAISLAIRSLLLLQFQVLGLIGYMLASYAYVTIEGFPWWLSVAPLYAVGAIGLGLYVARVNREDSDKPAPEWYFARTLEPTP